MRCVSERLPAVRAVALGDVALQPQEVGEPVLEQELRHLLVAELLAEPQEHVLGDLLADDHGRVDASGRIGGLHFELVEVQRAAEGFGQRRHDEARGNAAGLLRERGLLRPSRAG